MAILGKDHILFSGQNERRREGGETGAQTETDGETETDR